MDIHKKILSYFRHVKVLNLVLFLERPFKKSTQFCCAKKLKTRAIFCVKKLSIQLTFHSEILIFQLEYLDFATDFFDKTLSSEKIEIFGAKFFFLNRNFVINFTIKNQIFFKFFDNFVVKTAKISEKLAKLKFRSIFGSKSKIKKKNRKI